MARITKAQEQTYNTLVSLHHKLIKSKFNNSREEFESVIAQIRDATKVVRAKEKNNDKE